jgi:hypothetical protein
MGGAAYAAIHIKRGSITAPKIHNGAVKRGKIADGAVTNAKLADGSVSTSKFAPDAVAPAVSGRAPFLLKLSNGQSQVLATNGSVSLEAACATNVPGSPNQDQVVIVARTTTNGAVMDGRDDHSGSAGSGFLDTTTPATDS